MYIVLNNFVIFCEFFSKTPEKYEIDMSDKKEILGEISKSLGNLETWRAQSIGESMQKVAQDSGIKNSDFFMILRVAVTGRKISPPLNESMEILGKEKTLKRVKV